MADDLASNSGDIDPDEPTETAGALYSPVLVDVDDLVGAVAESVSTSSVFDDWAQEDRDRVEGFYAAGLRQLRAEPRERGIMIAPDEKAASMLLSMTAQLAQDGVINTRMLESGVTEALYDKHDPGWARTGMRLLGHWLKQGRFDWRRPPEEPSRLPNDCRVAILGDWGTGLYGAPRCAESIAGDTTGFDLVVHIGDVYYSGTKREVAHTFLALWPWTVRPHHNEPVVFRACNSNHEMYSGGKPYVSQTLARFDQPSSAFALENDTWLVVGLDTAYHDWHLAERQADWLGRLLARDDDRRVVLFSHHQPFSHFAAAKGDLRSEIDKVVAAHPRKIVAWYWGHEHLCAVYDQRAPWGISGRCVGHGGFPYFRNASLGSFPRIAARDPGAVEWLVRVPAGAAPGALIVDGPNLDIGPKADERARYGPNGYMTIHLHDDGVSEEVRGAEGNVLWEGRIPLA